MRLRKQHHTRPPKAPGHTLPMDDGKRRHASFWLMVQISRDVAYVDEMKRSCVCVNDGGIEERRI
jgi:hypothetical protein